MGRLKISTHSGGHYFVDGEGQPFFYLADTVWMLFNKLTRQEIETLFADRVAKGFTAIQAVVFRDLFEPNSPNVAGTKPFVDDEAMHRVEVNPEWLAWVREVTELAAEHGLVMALLPTWGDKWNEHSNSAGPVVMDEAKARAYCKDLSDALEGCENVIWVLGGDSPVLRQEQADTIRAMAAGIQEGHSGDKLIAFHPSGLGSSFMFHSEPWLHMNSIQTSHYKINSPSYLHIQRLFSEKPHKPCLDMEPNYEICPMFSVGKGPEGQPFVPLFNDYDVRKSLYRTVLAGAAGFTYGCDPIRQLIREGDRVHIWPNMGLPVWSEALAAPGSGQIGSLLRLLAERSYFTRVPAQELLLPPSDLPGWPNRNSLGMDDATGENRDPAARISVARCTEGSWVMVYVPVRQPFDLDTSGLKSEKIRISLIDPTTGDVGHSFSTPSQGKLHLVPQRNLDTLFVLDAE